jgi:hypothetical protein
MDSSVDGTGTRSEMVVDAASVGPRETDTVAISSAVNAPADVENVPDVEFAETVKDVGVVRRALLDVIATGEPPFGAACERVTVQAVLVLGESVVAAQLTEVTVVGATREMLDEREDPFREAVITAV